MQNQSNSTKQNKLRNKFYKPSQPQSNTQPKSTSVPSTTAAETAQPRSDKVS